MTLTLPTIVSFARIALAPLVYALITADTPAAAQWAAIAFGAGALTDYADGWLARRRGEVTSFGVFFDPLADKFLVSAAFFGFASTELLPLWPALVVIARDVATTLLRAYADDVGQPVVTSRAAKAKTFLQMAFVVWLLGLSWLGSAGLPFSAALRAALESDFTLYAMLALTGYTVWTGAEYFAANRAVVRRFFAGDARGYCSEWLATGFGVGYAPFMPGTFGSLAALGVGLATQNHGVFLALGIGAMLLGLWAIPEAERRFGSDSPRSILDEIGGMWLTLAWPYVPVSAFWAAVAFGLFRLFDVLKPFPIRWANGRSGAVWVLADDALAAAAAAAALHLLYTGGMFLPFAAAFFGR